MTSPPSRRSRRAKVARAGLAERVDIELLDYWRVQGAMTPSSVEMIEAVGHEYLPTYYRTLHDRLAPGGRAALQAILMPHERMLATLGTFTWIHKWPSSPGGFLPLAGAARQHGRRGRAHPRGLALFGQHYAETLRLWDEASGRPTGTAGAAWL
ncbi:MAG: class I SAM-dependent methyltransferase [Nocardioides sp.]